MADELKDKVDEIVEKAKEIAAIGAKKAGEFAQMAAEKTGDVIDAAKKRIDIEKIEYAINKKYRELGKAYYTSLNSGEDADIQAVVDELDALNEALELLNSEECCCGEEDCCCEDECCEEEKEPCCCSEEPKACCEEEKTEE